PADRYHDRVSHPDRLRGLHAFPVQVRSPAQNSLRSRAARLEEASGPEPLVDPDLIHDPILAARSIRANRSMRLRLLALDPSRRLEVLRLAGERAREARRVERRYRPALELPATRLFQLGRTSPPRLASRQHWAALMRVPPQEGMTPGRTCPE